MPDVQVTVIVQDELQARLARLEDEERWLISVLGRHDKTVRSLFQEHGPILATNHQQHVKDFADAMYARLRWVQEEMKRVSAFAEARDPVETKLASSVAQLLRNHKEA